MQGYELTERGKIVIAVIIVVVLLALSAALMIRARANQPSNDIETEVSESPPSSYVPVTSAVSDSPPPSGGGFDEPDPSNTPINIEPSVEPTVSEGQEGNSEEASPDDSADQNGGSGDGLVPPNGNDSNNGYASHNGNLNAGEDSFPEQQTDPPTSGSIDEYAAANMLSFLFAPETQDELDSETKQRLGEIVKSSNNAFSGTVAVETAMMSVESSQTLMIAVNKAFAEYGVSEFSISHIQQEIGEAGEIVEVNLHFIASGGK